MITDLVKQMIASMYYLFIVNLHTQVVYPSNEVIYPIVSRNKEFTVQSGWR